MKRAGSVRSREPVDPIRFSRWACRACVGVDAVLLVLLLAGAVGWIPSASLVVVVLLAVLVGAIVVFVRFSPITKLAFPPGSVAGAGHAEASVGEGREGWSSWSIPKRAEMVERARAVRALTATLERGGPVAPSDRAAARVHAYRQVATYTQGTATSSLLVAVAVPQLLGRHSLGWPWLGAALLVGVAVLLVFNVRRARRWRRIAEDHELVERRGSR